MDASTLMTTTHLEGYVYDRVLGRGGNGVVFEGRRKTDGSPVAIKHTLIKPWTEFVDDGDEVLFVPMEIFALKKLRGVPGVVRLLDWRVRGEDYVIVMDRAGEDLLSLMERSGPLREKFCREVARNLVRVVSFCMERGISHEDLKLENVVADPESGRVTLIDFGNADIFTCRTVHFFGGTECMYPPEWLRHGKRRMEESAVWTLGILIYEMATGSPLFRNPEDVLDEKIDLSLPEPRMENFVRRCLCHWRRPDLKDLLLHPWLLRW